MITQEEIAQALGNMTIPQIVALTKQLEAEWGVSATPQAVQTQTITQEVKKEEQTEFTVILQSFPAANKIAVIKMLREVLGVGLLEAKAFAENAPKTIRENVSADDAANLKAKMTEAGAVLEIK
jgi:large subunit ribosomal protein L7/L12